LVRLLTYYKEVLICCWRLLFWLCKSLIYLLLD